MSGGYFDYAQSRIDDIADRIEDYLYAQRADYLLSGDDSEEAFQKRLRHDLTDLAKGREVDF